MNLILFMGKPSLEKSDATSNYLEWNREEICGMSFKLAVSWPLPGINPWLTGLFSAICRHGHEPQDTTWKEPEDPAGSRRQDRHI